MWDDAATAREITEDAADHDRLGPDSGGLPRPPSPGAVLLIEAEHRHCRWPLWEGENEAKFICGSPRHSASTSYCCEHWIASGRARASRAPSSRYLGREPKAVARERLDLLTLQQREGF